MPVLDLGTIASTKRIQRFRSRATHGIWSSSLSLGMGDGVRQLVNPQLLPIATAEVVSKGVPIERNASDLRQLLRELLVEQIHDEVLYKSVHIPIEYALKLVDVTEHQAALSEEPFHDVGAVSSLVHGILLDQPVCVAIDACVCIVQTPLHDIVRKVNPQRPRGSTTLTTCRRRPPCQSLCLLFAALRDTSSAC